MIIEIVAIIYCITGFCALIYFGWLFHQEKKWDKRFYELNSKYAETLIKLKSKNE